MFRTQSRIHTHTHIGICIGHMHTEIPVCIAGTQIIAIVLQSKPRNQQNQNQIYLAIFHLT